MSVFERREFRVREQLAKVVCAKVRVINLNTRHFAHNVSKIINFFLFKFLAILK